MRPVVSVVLGTFERLDFLKLTLDSVREELKGTPHEIIVVDGGSADGTAEWIASQKDVITIIQHNRGLWNGVEIRRRSWGYFMNLGFRASAGKYICMISDDCLLVPGAITNGIRRFEERLSEGVRLGALAFYWRNWPDQESYNVGLTLGKKVFVNHGMYLRSALEEVGFIDEETFHFYHADGDLSLKLWQRGYVCEESPQSFVEHYTHANMAVRATNFERQKQDWNAYLNKWRGIFYDPSDTDTGSWISVEYADTSNTALRFRPLHHVRIVPQIKNSVKSVLNKAGLLEVVTRFVRSLRGTA
ncbi:MAG: glycosyltransferase [Gemmatimonadaceae bacterium]|nr:glycosyltransferase [Gemmatimonadaceae bacterium]